MTCNRRFLGQIPDINLPTKVADIVPEHYRFMQALF